MYAGAVGGLIGRNHSRVVETIRFTFYVLRFTRYVLRKSKASHEAASQRLALISFQSVALTLQKKPPIPRIPRTTNASVDPHLGAPASCRLFCFVRSAQSKAGVDQLPKRGAHTPKEAAHSTNTSDHQRKRRSPPGSAGILPALLLLAKRHSRRRDTGFAWAPLARKRPTLRVVMRFAELTDILHTPLPFWALGPGGQ